MEGLKTIAFEYVEQCSIAPDVVIVPVGSGGLLLGVYKGFKEMRSLGFTDADPRFIAVQTVGYTSIYDTIHEPYSNGTPSETPLADGIAVPSPPRLLQIVEAIKESRGEVIVVNDEQVFEAFRELARKGLFVEPTSATVLAALKQAIKAGLISKGDVVYAPLTGSGLKAVDKILKFSSHKYRE